jgi:hypothetical protein
VASWVFSAAKAQLPPIAIAVNLAFIKRLAVSLLMSPLLPLLLHHPPN